MTVVFPEAVKAHGNTGLVVSTTEPTDVASPSLATDINAGTSLNVSQYVFGEIEFTKTVNKGAAPRRMGQREVFQEFGEESHEIGSIMLTWGPQEDDAAEVNEAKAIFIDGAELWFYIRRGKDAETPYAVADKVEVRHVRIDGGRPGRTGDGEFDQYAWMCEAIDLEPPVYVSAVAA